MAQSESTIFWDHILVGGGLSASVVTHRLIQRHPEIKILVIEAGPNANNRSDIVWPTSTNLIGGDFDWNYTTVPQTSLDGRKVGMPSGKALGGGTVINTGGWVRGDKHDYDLWGTTVKDERWSYSGMLPYMKKSEKIWSDAISKGQHGLDGPASIQSVTSTNRQFPLRERVLRSWNELGVHALDDFDANAGSPLGIGDLQENKVNGRREIASAIYPLDGATVMTDTLVAKVLVEPNPGDGHLSAVGVQLEDGTEIRGRNVILAAGALRSPQILMLSGIGPSEELEKQGIPVLLHQPGVGSNLTDHGLFPHAWKVQDPGAGWAIGSGNPLFNEPQYGWGGPIDFVVSTDVPKVGLAAPIQEDEGAAPNPATHPLLAHPRTFVEHVLMYAGAPDGSLLTLIVITLLPTARGSVRLASPAIRDPPLIDPNFLGTAVDRYVAREGVKLQLRFTTATEVGRDVFGPEAGAAGFDSTFGEDSTDEYIDARLRAGFGTSYHPMGTLAMGSVVDTNLRVKGVDNLRVVDASVFPVPITGHLQVATYALAEQAAEIILSGIC
ncbi:putative glucose dehydrogenase [Xylariomycetidae sp. FL2044]|nr:putative glucose dehydrogenase [Xylariomycetidae sp. FL2044]